MINMCTYVSICKWELWFYYKKYRHLKAFVTYKRDILKLVKFMEYIYL